MEYIDGLNMYEYVRSNPVMQSDFSGSVGIDFGKGDDGKGIPVNTIAALLWAKYVLDWIHSPPGLPLDDQCSLHAVDGEIDVQGVTSEGFCPPFFDIRDGDPGQESR